MERCFARQPRERGSNGIGANLANADFTGATMKSLYFVANFAGADLHGADLSGSTFSTCDLHFGCFMSDFTNADFTNVNLTGAVMAYTKRSGVIWSHTTCPDGTVSDTNGTSPQSCDGHGGGL